MTNDIPTLERNLKAVGVLLAAITMENLEALRDGVYIGDSQKYLKGLCANTYNNLNRLSKYIKDDLQATGVDPDVQKTLKETLDTVYALADLDDTERKRVSGLIAKLKKEVK